MAYYIYTAGHVATEVISWPFSFSLTHWIGFVNHIQWRKWNIQRNSKKIITIVVRQYRDRIVDTKPYKNIVYSLPHQIIFVQKIRKGEK